MKKIFAICFALIILLSGMHLTIASHFCGGQLSATKISMTSNKASCGMDDIKTACPSRVSLTAKSCCKDEVSVYAVDHDYATSSFNYKPLSHQVIHVLLMPVSFVCQSIIFSKQVLTNVSPPGKIMASVVNLADICVFRK